MTPGNPLETVRGLGADEAKCQFHKPVLDSLRTRGMDSDDLLEIVKSELGEAHCYASRRTEKYYPGTVSDYYTLWVDVCGDRMFLKRLVSGPGTADEQLVITSFKKDRRHGG